jgi:hypothetical protein
VIPRFNLGPPFCKPCFGREPKVKVAIASVCMRWLKFKFQVEGWVHGGVLTIIYYYQLSC